MSQQVREIQPFVTIECNGGISGSVATPVQHAGRQVDMWTEGGTDVNRFMDFIDDILEDIGQGTPGNRRCFTMDNLIAHK